DVTATAKLTESEVAINVNPVQPAPINFDTGGHVPLELGDVLAVTTNMPAGATSLTWTYPTEKFSGETGSAANQYLLTLIQGSEDEELSESTISVVANASHGGASPSREGADDVIAVTNNCDGGLIYGGLCWASSQSDVSNANVACSGGWRVPSADELVAAAASLKVPLSNTDYWSSNTGVSSTVSGGCEIKFRTIVQGSTGAKSNFDTNTASPSSPTYRWDIVAASCESKAPSCTVPSCNATTYNTYGYTCQPGGQDNPCSPVTQLYLSTYICNIIGTSPCTTSAVTTGKYLKCVKNI
ncbi:MAG: hypothetical protein LBN93_06860, partial [Candidatus Symbiothrix sp.]|nr:hypothetical protein [Candidatus Symbiothrix sp.]